MCDNRIHDAGRAVEIGNGRIARIVSKPVEDSLWNIEGQGFVRAGDIR
jgi:hypothetical protein